MKKQTGQKEIIKKVLEYIRPQWFRVLLSLLMAVISVAPYICRCLPDGLWIIF